MARKRRRRSHSRRRHHSRRRGGGGHGGIMGALAGDAPVVLAAALYGVIEQKSKADPNFILNKAPKPIAGLGFAGNTALTLYALGYFTRNRYVRLAARGTAAVAAYQLAARGKLFAAGTDIPTLSGLAHDRSVDHRDGRHAAFPPESDSNHFTAVDGDLGALEYEDQHEAASHT